MGKCCFFNAGTRTKKTMTRRGSRSKHRVDQTTGNGDVNKKMGPTNVKQVKTKYM
jgi:hypothetical protein